MSPSAKFPFRRIYVDLAKSTYRLHGKELQRGLSIAQTNLGLGPWSTTFTPVV